MALPNSNISVAMVKSAIGAATNDVGQLCIHPNVNRWSKWKPVRLPQLTPISASSLKGANYGFDIPTLPSIESLINYHNGRNSWEYLKPTGGYSSPYRLADFRNYDHNADKFYSFRAIPQAVPTDTDEITVRMSSTDLNSLKWSDFDMQDMHFGALIVGNLALNEVAQVTSPTPITENQLVDVSLSNIPKSFGVEYQVYAYIAPVLAGSPIHYRPLDGGNVGSFFLSQPEPELTIQLNGTLDKVLGTVEWTLNIINHSWNRPLYNVVVQLRYGDNSETDPLEIGEGEKYIGTVSNPSGLIDSGMFIGFTDYDTRGGYMYFSHSTTGGRNYSGRHSLIIK